MPAGNYEKDAVSGVEYGPGYVQEHIYGVELAPGASFSSTELKAMRPPRGQSGAIATITTYSAAGSATCPVIYLYKWHNTNTVADDGTNILKPTSLGAADAGRWMLVTTLT